MKQLVKMIRWSKKLMLVMRAGRHKLTHKIAGFYEILVKGQPTSRDHFLESKIFQAELTSEYLGTSEF